MSGTIFQNVANLYRLKVPSRKQLTREIINKAHTLAMSFYDYVFKNQVKKDVSKILFNQFQPAKLSIREAYTNMFYSFPTIKQNLLDFIGCLICLVGDVLFSVESLQQSKQVQVFLGNLEKQNLKLREYLFIQYTFETIGYKIVKQSATIIFERYILSESHAHSNLESKFRINMQLKTIKKILQENGEFGDLKLRVKKKVRHNNMKSYQEQINEIMETNKTEIDEENKNNHKFQKFLTRCITQGTVGFDSTSSQRYNSGSTKFSAFLKTIKNCQIFIQKPKRKKQEKQYNSRSFEYWQSVLSQMKNSSDASTRQLMHSLSHPQPRPAYSKIEESYISLRKGYMVKAQRKQSNQNGSNRKILIKQNNMLPDIKQHKGPIMTEQSVKEFMSKERRNDSRKLKRQLSSFLCDRKKRVY